MKCINLFFVLFLTILFCVRALGYDKAFDQRYNEVYSDKIASNVGEAYRIADSLYSAAQNDLQRIKALMLLANITHSTGDVAAALAFATRAQRIAETDGFLEWESRTAGFLATTFRNVGLYSESKKYLKKANVTNEKQRDARGYALTKVNILQERAFHELADSNYVEALKFLMEAKHYTQQDTSSNPRGVLVRATNDQLIGICYLHMDKLVEADSAFLHSLLLLGVQESNLKPYIYRGLAEVKLRQNKHALAEEYLAKAAPYINTSNREELKLLLYETYIKFYSQSNPDKAAYYQKMHAEVTEKRMMTWQRVADQLLESKEVQRRGFRMENIIVGVVLIVLIMSLLIFLIVKNRINGGRTIQDNAPQDTAGRSQRSAEAAQEEEVNIAEETQRRLIAELEDLENNSFYLQTDISLSKLSAMMHTNVRYISYIFRKYRKKDFNAYLQEKRVSHIISLLEEDPSLLNCKISYLASICGFTSHSKFSIAFRAETGVLPSDYIQRLRDQGVGI